MDNAENNLTLLLCDYLNPDIKALETLLPDFATAKVLGDLFLNRMQTIAYGVLSKHQLDNKIGREFRNSLKCSYEQAVQKNESFFVCLKKVSNFLHKHSDKYAMLKGAVLCSKYPLGYRMSNDIDLLVRPGDISVIGNTLTDAGFEQGYIKNDEFVKATREEIIRTKMSRGETVPYILQVDLPYMKFLEVDINFSLDYKISNNKDIDMILECTHNIKIKDFNIPTLQYEDFFIHLCVHLYKEASTMPWVKMKRDMSLYKFCDIYSVLSIMDTADVYKTFLRAAMLGMDTVCACAVVWTKQLFDNTNENAYKLAEKILTENSDMLHTVVSPAQHKLYRYTELNIKKRFFSKNRMRLLEEVTDAKNNDETK